eukprot:Selendium_serpulae@DN5555_c0_g2_i1.p1
MVAVFLWQDGLDTSPQSIRICEAGGDEKLENKGTFLVSDIETFRETAESKFDVVVASEVIEHVRNPQFFFESLVAVTKDNGTIIITTINKTLAAYLTVIQLAENILRLIPKGVHQYEKFIAPTTLNQFAKCAGAGHVETVGLFYLPIFDKFIVDPCSRVNYMSAFRKL